MNRLILSLATLALITSRLSAQQMAITIDDIPAHGNLPPGVTRVAVTKSMLETFQAQHLPPVYGFLNAEAIVGDPDSKAALQLWHDSGEPIGNHTWSHPDLNAVTAGRFEANIQRDEPLLSSLMVNRDWHWFRYPYLHEGETLQKNRAVRSWLEGRGYRIAQVNMDFEDYLWNDPYARCSVRHNDAAIAKLHDSYLATAEQYINFFRKISQTVYHRDVKYILLLHIGAFDAKMLPELLAMYRRHGFSFISLEDAESDPAYKDDPDVISLGGGQLEQMMQKLKLKLPPNSEPEKELEAICR